MLLNSQSSLSLSDSITVIGESRKGTPSPSRRTSHPDTNVNDAHSSSPIGVHSQPAETGFTGGISIARQSTLDNGVAGILSLALSRIPHTISSSSTAADSALPNPYKGLGTPSDPYLVDWLPEERANPYNWSSAYRWLVTFVIAASALCVAFASSSYSAALQDLHREFPAMGQEQGIAGLSLYVLGFGIGPLIWAPVSEIWGRNVAFFASYPLFCLFNMGGALSRNVPSILIFRLLAGTFGAAPLVTAGGQVGDMWALHERALATSLFSLAPFLGPVTGPIVGGFVAQSLGWRAVFWTQCIFAAVMCTASFLLVPETYAPTLLKRKAKQLSKEAAEKGTGEVFISKYDVIRKSKSEIVVTGLCRPFAMIAKELIVFCLGLYAAIIYGTMYLFFTAFPLIFQHARGWSLGQSGLAFLGIGIGLVIGNCLTPISQKYYLRAVRAAESDPSNPTGAVPPEARLPTMCAGAVMLPIGLFWFAWTSQPSVHWILPILASIPFGCGFLLIFVSINLYLIDSYSVFAASAMASNAVCRSVLGTIFPLFSVHLYTNLGLNWAGTLIAFLSLACAPMPFLFIKYGAYLRRNSSYAPSGPVTKEMKVEAEGLEPGMVAERKGDDAV